MSTFLIWQAVGGIMRPAAVPPPGVVPLRRRLWSFSHRYGGHALWVLGLVTATTGLIEMDDEVGEDDCAGAKARRVHTEQNPSTPCTKRAPLPQSERLPHLAGTCTSASR